MEVVLRYLNADLLADFVDPRSHQTDRMNFTVGTQLDKVTDFSTHVTTVFNAALEVSHPLHWLKFILRKGLKPLGTDDHFHLVTFRESTFIFRKKKIAGFNFYVYTVVVDIYNLSLNEI